MFFPRSTTLRHRSPKEFCDCGTDECANWNAELSAQLAAKARDRTVNTVGETVTRSLVIALLSLLATLAAWAWITDEPLISDAGAADSSAIYANGFETPGAGGGDSPVDYCANPQVNPGGFQRVDKSWTQVFSAPDGNPSAIYPAGVAFPTPVGANKGTYVVVAFTPFERQTVNLYVDQVQARPQDGYGRARPARTMMIAITPCHSLFPREGFADLFDGDLRAPNDGAGGDPFLRSGCREIENSYSLIWSTDPQAGTESDASVCILHAGTRYALVIAPVDPRDGIDPGEHTCEDVPSTATGCDVGVVLSSSNNPAKLREWLMRKAFGLPPSD